MTDNITLKEPVSILLTPQHVQVIIQALNEIPFKFAQPVIDHILVQCRDQVNGHETQQ